MCIRDRLSGGVNIERCDAWGHKTLLDRITPGSVFAETYACVPGTPMMVSAAVSYTHLDVYKRQGHTNCRRRVRP